MPRFPRRPLRRAAGTSRTARRIVDTLESRLLMHAGEIDTILPVTLDLNRVPAVESTTTSGTGPDLGATFTSSVTISGLSKYHSRPSAAAKLFLDFDGISGMPWGQFTVPTQTAWSTDSDLSTFSTSEQATIYEIWARVAEKYSPFNIDVTTEDPGNRTPLKTLDVLFASDDGVSWLGSQSGGIAYVGSFQGNTGGNTVFVFPQNLGNNAQYAAEAASHESGHAFGLNHQSTYSGTSKTNEYNSGNSLVAPIMGSSYTAQRGLWWNGTTTSSTTIQDDLAVIANTATNRFGYAPDDHTLASGDALSASDLAVSGYGVIEKMTDTDAFSFTTGSGNVSLTVDSARYGGMLDLKLSLYDALANLVASANNQVLGESLNVTVAAGAYKLVVASNGGYGDLGQYAITGTVAAGPVTQPLAGDINSDGTVNALDLNILASNWQSTSGTWTTGDVTGDGKVDGLDINILAAHWNTVASATASTTTVAATDAVTASLDPTAAATITTTDTTLASLDPVATHGRGKRAHHHG